MAERSLTGSGARRRLLLLYSGLALLLLIVLVVAIGLLRSQVYSPAAFVGGYLNALAARDAQHALAFPGVELSANTVKAESLPSHLSRELLRDDALGQLGDVSITRDVGLADGDHRVEAAFRLGTKPSSATFTVHEDGAIFGLLPLWRFAVSPLAVDQITVQHDDTFDLNGLTLNTRASNPGQGDAFTTHANYLVLTPGEYRLTRASAMLASQPVVTRLTQPGAPGRSVVDVEPTATFDAEVQAQLDRLLRTCTTQKVLEPTGCPFGVEIDDRIQGVPTWSIITYPPVAVSAGPHGWRMVPTEGVAHVAVTVESLFDGTITHRSTDQNFAVSLPAIVLTPGAPPRLTMAAG